MGCQTYDSININEEIIISKKKKQSRNDTGPDPKFPDMEEWEGDRYKGVGIKRMKGYKCTLPINKLNEKREQFWTAKLAEDEENWKIIQQICIFDEERANLMLGNYNFQVATNCVNHIINDEGYHFHIPNYCINDPYFEKNLSIIDEPEKKINLILYDVEKDNKISFAFSNHDKGKKVKDEFLNKQNDKGNYKIRLFFSGMEIKDNDYLYQHKLDNDFKIQVMKIKL